MSASLGPDIITDGLVFAFDPGDERSLQGEPTTNLLSNPAPTSAAGYTAYGGTGSVTYDSNTSSLVWQRSTYETWGAFINNDTLFNGTLSTSSQYTASFEWKQAGTISDASTWFEIVQGNDVDPAVKVNMVANSTYLSDGFYRFSYTFTPANTGISAYFRIWNPLTTGTNIFYWRKLQLEQKPYRAPFTVGTRNTANDISTNRSILTINSLPTYSSSSNGSLVLDGVDDYITAPFSSSFPTGSAARSLSAWFRVTSLTGGREILGIGGNTGLGTRSALWIDAGNVIGVEVAGGGVFTSSWSGINNWVNLCATYQAGGDTHSFKIYVNGIERSTTASGSAVTLNTSNTACAIGTVPGALGAHPFAGNIGNVSIYNRAITAQEVQQNFQALRSRFGV